MPEQDREKEYVFFDVKLLKSRLKLGYIWSIVASP
jgi:hypothetical protein